MPREKQHTINLKEADKKRIERLAKSKKRTQGELVGYWSELDERYDLDRPGFLGLIDEDYKNGFIQFGEDGYVQIGEGQWLKKIDEETNDAIDLLVKRYGISRNEAYKVMLKMLDSGDKYFTGEYEADFKAYCLKNGLEPDFYKSNL